MTRSASEALLEGLIESGALAAAGFGIPMTRNVAALRGFLFAKAGMRRPSAKKAGARGSQSRRKPSAPRTRRSYVSRADRKRRLAELERELRATSARSNRTTSLRSKALDREGRLLREEWQLKAAHAAKPYRKAARYRRELQLRSLQDAGRLA